MGCNQPILMLHRDCRVHALVKIRAKVVAVLAIDSEAVDGNSHLKVNLMFPSASAIKSLVNYKHYIYIYM